MKTTLRWLFLLVSALLSVAPVGIPTAAARHRHLPKWIDPANIPALEPAALPAETPPAINPDAVPSASLQPFLNTHLDKILAPLGTPAFAQGDVLTSMKSDYARALTATPEVRRPAYQLAVAVCESLANAIEERRKAVTALEGSYNMRSSEAYQPRGGGEATKESNKNEAFFYNSQKNNWLQNAATLRQQITTLYGRERAAETQAGEWTLPPARVVAAAPTPTPAAPSVAAPAPETDPVVGDWTWPNHGPVLLKADHSIQGSRHGTWKYTATTDAGRNYEMHWAHKGWVDYVVLSSDGKLLDGKRHDGVRVTANR